MIYIPNWLIGVFLTLLSTAVGSLGKVLIRCVYLLQSSTTYSAFLKANNPFISVWILNCPLTLLSLFSQLCIVVLNPLLSVLSYSFAAQSMLTPFAGLSIVWSMLFSSILLPEKPDRSKMKSILLITIGCLVISLSASHNPTQFSIEDLIGLSKQPSNILFTVIYCAVVGILVVLAFGRGYDQFHGLAYGLASGVLGGNQIYIKSLSTVIMQYAKGVPVYTYPWVYYCLVMVILTAGGGILCLNAGLRKYEAMYIIPLYQGSFIIVGSISGILFFNEMENASFTRIAVYVLGILLNIAGLIEDTPTKQKYACYY